MKRTALALTVTLVLLISAVVRTAEVSSATDDYWTTKAPMPSAVSSAKAAVLDGKIYVVGAYASIQTYGKNTLYVYDPAQDTWAVKKSMATSTLSFALAACQNKIYVIGGITFTNLTTGEHVHLSTNTVYDPATDTWTTKASMPTKRSQLSATTVGNKIYAIGGRTGEAYSTVGTTEIYDVVTDSWTPGQSMLYSVVDGASAAVDNKIYVVGGQDEFLSGDLNVNFTQIYDPAADSWSLGNDAPVADVWEAGAGSTSGELAPKRIYVIGGIEGFGAGSNENIVYDPAADVWVTAASMPTARFNPAVAVVDDLLYVIGGGQAMGSLATNEQYTPIGYGVIMEFPSWTILPTIVTATMFMALVHFRKRKPKEGTL